VDLSEVYTLTSPAAISFYGIAETLSEILGKEVSYINILPEKAKEAMLNMGLSEWRAARRRAALSSSAPA
jgi:uncharacterized protein YbjT (DUF2867 family)